MNFRLCCQFIAFNRFVISEERVGLCLEDNDLDGLKLLYPAFDQRHVVSCAASRRAAPETVTMELFKKTLSDLLFEKNY